MRILIAPDSFKGSLDALNVAKSIEKGILKVMPEAKIIKVPMGDGGEGTVQSMVYASNGETAKVKKKVTGPLGEKVEAYFGILGDKKTAVIEMASASGFALVPPEKADPRLTTTYGTGELIKAALDEGVKKIIIGIGGSATNDGGVGMAQALGISFKDEKGNEIGFGGAELAKINSIDISQRDSRIDNVIIEVACDVSNPMYGIDGAAYVYGPQKGATAEIVELLDRNLRHFNDVVKKELDIDLQSINGAGAAGGLGGGLVAFLGAELRSGIDIVLEVNKIEEKIRDVGLVITGEGRIDSQTVRGKTPMGVLRVAKKYGLPVIAVVGEIGDGSEELYKVGFDALVSIINKPLSLEEAIEKTSILLEQSAEQIFRILKICKLLPGEEE
jgi:glycerate 2-kinase